MAKKRANGEGNIRKRKDGRWEGRFTAGYDPDTGKAIQKNVLGKTQAEVREKLKEAIEKSGRVDMIRADRYTLGQWVTLWYDVYCKPNLRPSTARYYQMFIDKHVIPKLGKIKLSKLRAIEIQKFYKEAGLEHIRFHDLRHTFATLALQNGVDVKTVSAMLGHSNAGFTLATYTHTTTAAQHQAAAIMGSLVSTGIAPEQNNTTQNT